MTFDVPPLQITAWALLDLGCLLLTIAIAGMIDARRWRRLTRSAFRKIQIRAAIYEAVHSDKIGALVLPANLSRAELTRIRDCWDRATCDRRWAPNAVKRFADHADRELLDLRGLITPKG